MTLDPQRIRGCLFGSAIGDALGRPLKETAVTRRIQFKFGREAPKRLAFASAPPALVSDETQQMLFVADGVIRHLIHDTDRTQAVRRSLLHWLRSQRGPGLMHSDGWLAGEQRLYFRRLPERSVELALEAVDRGELPSKEHPLNNGDGPTAMTRSLAYGIALAKPTEAFNAAFDDASWTHGDPVACLAAGAYASLIHGLVRGLSFAQAMAQTQAALVIAEGLDGPIATVIEQARQIAAAGPPEPEHLEAFGDGRTATSALAIGLTCAMSLEDSTAYGFVRAMWRSVCHGGSSDTTGSLTGALLGAMLGPDVVPHPWLIDLEMLEVYERISRDLFAASTGRPVTEADYPE